VLGDEPLEVLQAARRPTRAILPLARQPALVGCGGCASGGADGCAGLLGSLKQPGMDAGGGGQVILPGGPKPADTHVQIPPVLLVGGASGGIAGGRLVGGLT
jgi:hypothetical protein